MALRRDVIDRLGREIAGYEERIAETREAARLSAVAEAEAEREKATVAEAEARGGLSGQAARTKFEEAAAKARRHADEQERLTLLGEKLEEGLGERRRELAAAEFEQAAEKAEKASAGANAVAKKLGALLDDVAKTVGELERKRETVMAAVSRAAELCPEGIDFSVDVDEPAWRPDGWEAIVELLQAGPQAPGAAEAQKIAEQARRQRRRAIADVVDKAARTGREPELDDLPEELRADARRAYEGRLEGDPTARRTRERTEAINAYVETGDKSALADWDPAGGTVQEAERRRGLRVKEDERGRRSALAEVG